MDRPVSGTREWASATANCVNGCSHNCLYCYAKYNACDRFKRMAHEDWEDKKVRPHDVSKKPKRVTDGRVMFPTTHDICPDVLDACKEVIRKHLEIGNELLIVSKPHYKCILDICKSFEDYKEQILFRFTIGARSDEILKYWEPGAPGYAERLAALSLAYHSGYATSVSMEPLLDSTDVLNLVKAVTPVVTDSIWIGKLNQIEQRVKVESDVDQKYVDLIKEGQTDERIMEIYKALKEQPLIRWKESIKKIVGLDRPTQAGLDV